MSLWLQHGYAVVATDNAAMGSPPPRPQTLAYALTDTIGSAANMYYEDMHGGWRPDLLTGDVRAFFRALR
ncbi:hypothetical protein AB0C21_27325 [Spirillospora sp. NPDC049024]